MRESEPPPAPLKTPKTFPSYKYRLLTPTGTILANCPTQKAALQSAEAMYGRLSLKKSGRDWKLFNSQGVLVAIVAGKK
jgi:hypothetical protein